MKFFRIITFLLALTFLFQPTSFAGNSVCLDKVCFDKTLSIGDQKYPLRGVSLFEFWKMDLYTGALYLAEDVQGISRVLGDVPKALVLHYHRGIPTKWMNRVAKRKIKRNHKETFDEIEERVDQLGNAYQKVGKGDRYMLAYHPETGTSLHLNNNRIIEIPGVDFQTAYFGIWLAEDSVSEKFRDTLLGVR